MLVRALAGVFAAIAAVAAGGVQSPMRSRGFLPGERVLLDAHNAYPEQGRWADRIDRALATGLPIAIEQDLAWCQDRSGTWRSVVSHEKTCVGGEPTLGEHFFDRIRPLMESALVSGDRSRWPIITLNLDFKTNEPAHHRAVWALLGEHERWLTTAPRGAGAQVARLEAGPLLVLTGDSDIQQQTFENAVVPGGRLRLFGAVPLANPPPAGEKPAFLPEPVPRPATNYRRWWNNPWSVVEEGGQQYAGEWTAADDRRLRRLVDNAHRLGLWIRFYTLNGHDPGAANGWTASYNFGSKAALDLRWDAAIRAGVDFIATDQYEGFAARRDAVGPSPVD
jgi:hypothetical protein